MVKKLVKLDDTVVSYYVVGKGQPVVFLHGLTGSASSWQEIVERLGKNKGISCIVPDLPGLGYSEKLNLRYTLDKDVDFLFRFVQKITKERIILVGDSSSGTISLKFALKHPHKIEKLILIETPFYFAHKKLKLFLLPCLYTVEKLRILQWILEKIRDSDRLLYFFWHLLWPGQKFLPTFSQNRDILNLRRSTIKAYVQAVIDLLKADLRNEVSKIKIPTLIISGEKDFWVPRAVAEDLAKRIKGAKLMVLKGVTHGGFEEKSGVVEREILEFIKGY